MSIELADEHWTKGAAHALSVGALIDRARMEALEKGVEDIQQHVFNGRYSASIHLLVGFAMELLLKSACLLHGGDANRLRSRALRHDLVALLDEAEGQGFRANVAELRAIAELLREPHLNHQFRYGGAEEVIMPNLEATLQALYDLCDQLQGPIEEALAAEAGQ